MARAPVRLNVYDMYWLNEYASTVGFGVYHSGIEVYGVEYAYGGHPFAFSGVFENTPQDAEELGENFKFRESILIGETDFSATDVRHMIQLFGHEYRGDKYHLISKNCNHFSAAFAKTLTGRDIPGWVNRLASFSGSIPFLEKCLPQEWLTPAALKQTIEERRRSNEFSSIDSAEEIHEESSLNRRSSLPCNGRSQESREKNGAIAASRLASKYTCSASPPSSSTSKSSTTINNTSLSSSRNTSSSATTLNQVPSFSRLWNSIKNITQSDSVNTQNDSSQLNSHSHKQ